MEPLERNPPISSLGPVDLFTIGYQGRSLDQFVSVLTTYDIDILIDVRRTPWSHKPGFSKAQLASVLGNKRIDYVHLPEFGSAPDLRERLKQTGDWEAFARAYSEHLIRLNGRIESVLGGLQGKRICLLCMEANPAECHRSILAGQIVDKGLSSPPVHL